uniref:FIST signal transduction protein n=1 Tax=Pontibacterium sp. TaxID=2036026 RepID=UPI003566E8E1
MRVEQYSLDADSLYQPIKSIFESPDLVLVFASPDVMRREGFYQQLCRVYSKSVLMGCSTAGEILDESVFENTVVVNEISFDNARCEVVSAPVGGIKNSWAAGVSLAEKIDHEGLRAVFVLSPGVNVNGSAIVNGMASILGADLPISGGLAADNADFVSTVCLTPHGVEADHLSAVALYGDSLTIEHSSFGGWEAFGPRRKVTRSDGNILYELDGKPALDLYKRYLGEYARDLPSSALLFPLEMLSIEQREEGVIRTILGIDEEEGSLTLAGDIDPDGYLRLMHTSIDGLIDGAGQAALHIGGEEQNRLAILVSCVGRKLVMGDEVAAEVEAVKGILGESTTTTGYYSYGEISPGEDVSGCFLHNQTMTLTV